jgi:acylphosphatase
MVNKEFYITGERKDIFNVGFRPALIALGDEVGIKVHATNVRKDNKIRVVASGSQDSIIMFYDMIRKTSVYNI